MKHIRKFNESNVFDLEDIKNQIFDIRELFYDMEDLDLVKSYSFSSKTKDETRFPIIYEFHNLDNKDKFNEFIEKINKHIEYYGDYLNFCLINVMLISPTTKKYDLDIIDIEKNLIIVEKIKTIKSINSDIFVWNSGHISNYNVSIPINL